MASKTKTNEDRKSHAANRRKAKAKNFPPNDLKRRDRTEKAGRCQRCHEDHKTQYSVVRDDNGKPKKVKAVPNRSHYCGECATERLGEVQRHDERPAKAPAKTKKAPAKKKAAAKKAPAKRVKKQAAKKAAPAPEVAPDTEADPF